MTIKCPTCGEVHEDGTLFCDGCGTELPQPELVDVAVEEMPPEVPQVEEEEKEEGPAPPVEETPVTLVPVAKLVVTRGGQIGEEYPLSPRENEIGRWDEEEGYMPHVDLQTQDVDNYVHRRHAMIRFDGHQWWLEHLKEAPSNPTRVRGRGERLEVGKPVPLQDGDEIVVGWVILRFVLG